MKLSFKQDEPLGAGGPSDCIATYRPYVTI